MRHLLTALLTLMALSSQAAPLEVTLKDGERVRIGEHGPLLQAMILEDSRCPVDVQCLQAGQILLMLAVSPAEGTPPIMVAVSWPDNSQSKWRTRYPHPDYRFELLSLEPRACTSCKLMPGHTIHLRITPRKKP
ncbi:hypothetical protein [Leeia sp.]|uniref:hypothetical protein n=1 Tax=Leeia sp. TaxID=2884678 RepID=UPI0035B4EFE7